MSAAKLREAAKQDGIAKEQACRSTAVTTEVANNAAVWKEAFDDDQPLPLCDAADCYAT